MLCSAGFDNAGFDRCAISFVHQQTWQVFQNPNLASSRRRSAIVEIVLYDFQAWRSCRRQLQAGLVRELPIRPLLTVGADMFLP